MIVGCISCSFKVCTLILVIWFMRHRVLMSVSFYRQAALPPTGLKSFYRTEKNTHIIGILVLILGSCFKIECFSVLLDTFCDIRLYMTEVFQSNSKSLNERKLTWETKREEKYSSSWGRFRMNFILCLPASYQGCMGNRRCHREKIIIHAY